MTATFQIRDGDVIISEATGRPFVIEDEIKFNQDIRENLDSDVQANGTGADLDGVVGVVGDIYSLQAEITRRITDSFTSFEKVQRSIQRGDRTPAEQLHKVARIMVVPIRDARSGEIAGTSYAYRVDVLSKKNRNPVTVTGLLVR